MSKTFAIIGVAAALAWAAQVSAQSIVTERNISVEAAFKVVHGAIDACKKNGWDISVVVVDRNGVVRIAVRADSASPAQFRPSPTQSLYSPHVSSQFCKLGETDDRRARACRSEKPR